MNGAATACMGVRTAAKYLSEFLAARLAEDEAAACAQIEAGGASSLDLLRMRDGEIPYAELPGTRRRIEYRVRREVLAEYDKARVRYLQISVSRLGTGGELTASDREVL